MAKKKKDSRAATRTRKAAKKDKDVPAIKTAAGLNKNALQYMVHGQVQHADGSPAAAVKVVVFDKDVAGEDRLGEAITAADGAYRIGYSEELFRRSANESRGADLFVRIYDAQDKMLFQSKTKRNAPGDLRLDVKLPMGRFVVRGMVKDANGKPISGVTVRAFDRDLRKEQLLGKDTVTDGEGRYEIHYTTEEFAAAEAAPNAAPDLSVRALSADGQLLAESPTRFNAGQEDTIDLVIAAPALSEWIIISQAVIPLLFGQGPENTPLPPWELNDEDISFIIKETGLDREQVRLWVLAAKTAQEAALITTAPEPSPPIYTHHPAGLGAGSGNSLNKAIEIMAFYGWFRDGQPQAFAALMQIPTGTLMTSLEHAVARNHIPGLTQKFKDLLKKALDARRIDEVLQPAKQGEHASLGDILDTLGADRLNQDVRRKTAKLLQDVGMESDEFMPRLKEIIPDETQRQELRRTLRLGELTMKHAPMVKALQSFAAKSGNDTISGLAMLKTDQWLDLAYEHGAPLASFITPEQYANDLERTVETLAPTAVLAAKFENNTIVLEQPDFSSVQGVIIKHPGFNIASDDIDEFAKDNNIEPGTAKALGRLQHLKRLDARWDEVAVLINSGITSVAQITQYGREQFKRAFAEQLPEDRSEKIHEQAIALQAVSIGLMGHLQPMLFGVSAEVMGMHKNLAASKEKIISNPTLRKIFGALENCACDPCMSVLSPAAYLADLLRFIDATPEAKRELQRRRPDLYDLELSCENSKLELPHIDLAIEILENAVAFPYTIPLPAGTDVQAELSESFVGTLVRDALQKTAMDGLGALSAQKDTGSSTTWVVTDRYRRWTLDASSEILGIEAGKQGEKAVSFDPSILDSIDPVPVLDSGNIPANIEERVIKELEDGVIVKLPITAVIHDIMPLKSSLQSNMKKWEISFSSAGWINIELGTSGNTTGTLTMGDSGDGKLTTKYYSNNLLIAMKNDLNTGVISPLIVRTLSDGRMNTKNRAKGFIVTGADNWQFTYGGKRTIVYRPATIEIEGLSYQSTAADRDLFVRPQNRNPLAYQKLSGVDARFPWSLPYDHSLPEIRETLRAAGVSRIELLEASSSSTVRYASDAIARERLGLSLEAWNIVIDQMRVANNKVLGDWGLNITSSSQKTTIIDTYTDEALSATPFGKEGLLTRVSIVLQQARLKFSELQELLQADFINPGGTLRVQPDLVCKPSEMTLSIIDENTLAPILDRLHRFVRLWRATGWTIWELDLAINVPVIGNKALDANALKQIANFAVLKNHLNISIEMLATMFGGFRDKRYSQVKDGRVLELVPLYERIFQDRRLKDPPDLLLAYSAAVNSGSLPAGKNALIAAAVGIREADLDALTAATEVDPQNAGSAVSSHSLCWIFRNVVLAGALRLSLMEDYPRAWRLLGNNSIFSSPATMLAFLDGVDFVLESGFAWDELEYILQGTGNIEFSHGLPTAAAAEMLRALQQELEQLPIADQDAEEAHIGLSEDDLSKSPFSGLPGSPDERWEKHWGLTKVPGSGDWSVSDPKHPGQTVEGSPLDLLSRIDVLSQQAHLPEELIKSALKTAFVDPSSSITVIGPPQETVQNLKEVNLDRLERFLALMQASLLNTSGMDALLEVFCKKGAAEPLDWELRRLIEDGLPVLILRNRLQRKIEYIAAWWQGARMERNEQLAGALGLSLDELVRLSDLFESEYMPVNATIWDAPAALLTFVQGSSLLKQRTDLIVQYLARAMSIDPSAAECLLWERLHTRKPAKQPAMHLYASHAFSDSTNLIEVGTLETSDYYDVLLRMYKSARLTSKWKASSDEMQWLPKDTSSGNIFAGLVLDELPTPNQTTKVAFIDWQRSTALFRLAHSDAAMSALMAAYIKAFQKAVVGQQAEAARATLKEPFGFVPPSKTVDVAAVDLLKMNTGDLHLDPLRLSELIRLLGRLQRLDIDDDALKELTTDSPSGLSAERARMLLRPRFGESGWQKALKEVSNALRLQQRDRLVDYLLTTEGLRDANALYEYYLIDVEMSPCMNTTRMLQSTAAAQLFVQRCLFNLEKDIAPESIDRDRWEWMQNYRVWEANRKVFLYPENWLFPEVRDDRTETFRAFESALTQSEPSHENAIKALRQYLDDLVDVSQISVMGMYEHREETDEKRIRRTLYLVGRSPNPAYTFYWRKAIRYGEPGMRWTGWERIDQDLSGDHVIPFVFEGDLHIAWPLIKQIEKDGKKFFEVQLAWARKTSTGWTKRKNSRDPLSIEKLFNRDERSMFAFRLMPNSVGLIDPTDVHIEVLVAERTSKTIPEPTKPNIATVVQWSNPNPYGTTWRLQINADGYVKYTTGRVATGPLRLKIYGLRWESDVNKGSGYYSADATQYIETQYDIHPPFYSVSMHGDIQLKLEASAFGKTLVVEVDSISGLPGGSSASVDVKFLFTGIEDTDQNSTDPDAPLPMVSAGRFVLNSSLDAFWDSAGSQMRIIPSSNSFFWSGGLLEKGGGGISPFQPGFPEHMFLLQAPRLSGQPGILYVEEGGRRLLARVIEPYGNVIDMQPCGYSEASLYMSRSGAAPENLYTLEVQQKGQNTWFGVDSITQWVGSTRISHDPRDNASLGFDLAIPYAGYNWEVFYHLPLAAATLLSRQHRFEDARRWFHFVFDPTTNDKNSGRERFWRFLPFRTTQVPDTITRLLETLVDPDANQNKKADVEQQVSAWLSDPFNPYAVARMRASAFEWYTVVAYINNLLAWADQLFRRDTRESINEATLLYMMAAQILGPRPERIRARGASRQSLSYRALKTLEDESPSIWSTLADTSFAKAWNKSGISQMKSTEFGPLSSIGSLYFCVPPNEKLPELWDMVDDRLFKIRHCQNIEGVTRTLPLYEPPIDPELLIRAKAAGLDLADVLADRFAPLPYYRFQILLQKANEFCNEVKSLGAALLSAVEKKEAEHLALLRSRQEIDMLKLVESVKEEQVKEAQANIESLEKTRSNAVDRFVFLQRQLGTNKLALDSNGAPIVEQSLMLQVQDTGMPDDFRSLSLIQPEINQVWRMQEGHIWSMVAGGTKAAAGVFHMLGANPLNMTWAPAVGHGLSAVGDGLGLIATNASFWERRASQFAGWQRRRDEWVQQSRMTAEEIRQIDKQILALKIRKSIAEKELDNHRKQIEHASNIDDYMRHLKFSGESLYAWTESQLSGLYFSAYQMAYDLAKRAERAFQFEVGDDKASFVQFGHWDSLRKGLLSGERLSQNLRRIEAAYLDRNKRDQEITKHVSLRQLNGPALMRLRSEGECEFEIPEALFDLDFPGHYFRRIKSVSISMPCVVGPYTSVSGTLTLLTSKLREKSVVSGSYGAEDNHRSSYLPIQSISTSTGQNDSGLFELNFRDERYLPFEGAGAISRWRFKLPKEFRAFDYDTISDVILHIRYTSRDGGEVLATAATAVIKDQLNSIQRYQGEAGLVELISLRHEFPTEWAKYLAEKAATPGTAQLEIALSGRHFPFMFQSSIRLKKWLVVTTEDLEGLEINSFSTDSLDQELIIASDKLGMSDSPYLAVIYMV